jgi:hypothetical protein
VGHSKDLPGDAVRLVGSMLGWQEPAEGIQCLRQQMQVCLGRVRCDLACLHATLPR